MARQQSRDAAGVIRRLEDGREICLANAAGRAEYSRRKQQLWEEQDGLCALSTCRRRLSLLSCRLTGGAWAATGQLRDDRLRGPEGEKLNELVCKDCLKEWHRLRFW